MGRSTVARRTLLASRLHWPARAETPLLGYADKVLAELATLYATLPIARREATAAVAGPLPPAPLSRARLAHAHAYMLLLASSALVVSSSIMLSCLFALLSLRILASLPRFAARALGLQQMFPAGQTH